LGTGRQPAKKDWKAQIKVPVDSGRQAEAKALTKNGKTRKETGCTGTQGVIKSHGEQDKKADIRNEETPSFRQKIRETSPA